MDHPPPERDPVQLAYARGQLEAPVLKLREYARMLRSPGPGSPLTADFEKLARMAGELYEHVRRALDNPTSAADHDALRLLRHDLRGQAGRIVSLCELLAEDEADSLPEETVNEIRSIRDVARRVIDQIAVLVTFDPEKAASAAPELGLVLKPLTARECRTVEPGRVLLADDNADNRDLVTKILGRRGGHAVVAVPDGQAALDALEHEPFDIVLLDVIMPGLNGFEVLRRIRAHPGPWRHLPIVLMSALGEDEAVVAGFDAGADDYIHRPFNPDRLLSSVEKHLDRKRFRDRELTYQQQIQKLVRALFPPEVADEIEKQGTIPPRQYDAVGVLFLDVVGFTTWCEAHKDQPETVVNALQDLVRALEDVAARHGVQKIKTIGDAFLATTGLTRPDPSPVETLVRCGVEMMDAVAQHAHQWQVRIGIHIGPVVAGVIGATQFQFDIWGDTVNRASRLQALARPGGVVLSDPAWNSLAGRIPAARREVDVKGIGRMVVWDLDLSATRQLTTDN